MIDLAIDEKTLERNIAFCREKGIVLPTFAMLRDPARVPPSVTDRLEHTGLWDLNPANLFRISWHNQPVDHGGLYGPPNHLMLPPALTGCRAPIVMLVGRWFPTGAHKVGATYGCLVPGLVTGQFDPRTTKAVWPSTGNFCRGGAYISALLGCHAIAILPEGMSAERFDWLRGIAGEVIATPGSESNVKEIFDKCRELRNSGEDLQVFNQFDAFGNPLWHYTVTGGAVETLMESGLAGDRRLAGYVAASGSGGTLAAGYYLKKRYPRAKLAVAEALQCPTLLMNGFGAHRIEGIGDKHVPWIHDCRETDFVIAVDDAVPMHLLRLFNEPVGQAVLRESGIVPELVGRLDLLGISGIGNLIAAIKFAKYNELTDRDVVVSIATDSMQLYGSRLAELTAQMGDYRDVDAHRDLQRLHDVGIDAMKELSHYDKKAIHHLKYFTWVEQQGKPVEALNAQWYDHDDYWHGIFAQTAQIDGLIDEFNRRVGILEGE
jgi:cysteine synthase